MKALSLWQPWGSLIATGAKKFETRSWATNYKGPLLICASKRKPDEDDIFILDIEMPLPLGKALCVVELVDCLATDNMTTAQIGNDDRYGDFTPGRYAWKLENVRAFKKPFPIRGAQGLFDVDDQVVEKMLSGETETLF